MPMRVIRYRETKRTNVVCLMSATTVIANVIQLCGSFGGLIERNWQPLRFDVSIDLKMLDLQYPASSTKKCTAHKYWT